MALDIGSVSRANLTMATKPNGLSFAMLFQQMFERYPGMLRTPQMFETLSGSGECLYVDISEEVSCCWCKHYNKSR